MLAQQDQRFIFVFNKTWFKPGAKLGAGADAPVVHVRLPTKEQSLSSSCSTIINDLQSREEQDGLEPMQRLMFDFLKGLVHSMSQGEAYEAACKQRLQICEQLQAEVGMQRRASQLALTSLLRYYEAVARVVEKLESELGQMKELVAKTISHSKVRIPASQARKQLSASSCIMTVALPLPRPKMLKNGFGGWHMLLLVAGKRILCAVARGDAMTRAMATTLSSDGTRVTRGCAAAVSRWRSV